MLAEGADYGRGALPAAERLKMNVEFVSVNPTGPLHVGHARYASYGDALCRIFAFVGHDVTREFYVNDYGTQMLRFGQSLAARYGQRLGLDTPVPEEGYQGEYLLDLADELIAEVGERYRAARRRGRPRRERARRPTRSRRSSCGAATRSSPSSASRSSACACRSTSGRTRARCTRARASTAASPARSASRWPTWTARASSTTRRAPSGSGPRSTATTRTACSSAPAGEPTYFLSDIAYHRDKMDRGFAHMIDIWGADHHGYVPRMKAAFTALPPHDPDRLELIIGQLVNLLESGEAKRMSKRKGDIVTVDDLIDAIGVDAARFLLVGRSHDTTLELDIDLAREQSQQEPGVLRAVRARAHLQHPAQPARARGSGPAGAALPAVAVGAARARRWCGLWRATPTCCCAAADQRAPHRVHTYLGELAAEFHVFYRHCRVLGDDADVPRSGRRSAPATRDTLAGGLAPARA